MKVLTAAVFAVFACTVIGRANYPRDTAVHFTNEVNFTGDLLSKVRPENIPGRPAHGFNPEDYTSEDVWRKYECKGENLLYATLATDREAGVQFMDSRNPPSVASEWQGELRQEMHTWFWNEIHDEETDDNCQLGEHGWENRVLSNTMRTLGLSDHPVSEGGDNQCYNVVHYDPNNPQESIHQNYRVGDKLYRATGAYYEFGINTKGGAIYNFNLLSPKHAARMWDPGYEPSTDDLPRLRASSDILWGYWSRNNPDVKNIHYFFVIGCVNRETNQLIALSLAGDGSKLSPWPGATFSTNSEMGQALLGSVNGAAFAYFLFQHKAQLGPKTITQVTIFRDESTFTEKEVDPSLAFHVADYVLPPE